PSHCIATLSLHDALPISIVHGPERPVDVRIGHVSGERAATELGWRATTSFVDGVRAYVDWLAATSGSPVVRTESMIDGKAAAVLDRKSTRLNSSHVAISY